MGEFPFYGFKVLIVTVLAGFFLAGAAAGARFGLKQGQAA